MGSRAYSIRLIVKNPRESISNGSQERSVIGNVHLLTLFPFMYCSTALRMNVLLRISPSILSDCFTKETGNVIPSFDVIPLLVVPTILILLSQPESIKHFD